MKTYTTLDEIEQERARIAKAISISKNKSGRHMYDTTTTSFLSDAYNSYYSWVDSNKKTISLEKQLDNLFLQRRELIKNESKGLKNWLRKPGSIEFLNKMNEKLKISTWSAEITGTEPVFENFDKVLFSEEEYDRRVFFRPHEDRTLFSIYKELFEKLNY